jgi:hypothetical protein
MVSRLLRAALRGGPATGLTSGASSHSVAGFRPFPAEGAQVVTDDRIERLREESGL